MSTGIYTFPAIGDWSQYVAQRSPSTMLPSPQWDMMLAWMDPIRVLDNEAAGIAYGLDPAAAIGAQLDALGSWYDEPRSGLLDSEYRRIVLSRQQAQGATATVDAVWAVWLALTGADAGDARIVPVEPVQPIPVVVLEARVLTAPTATFLVRGWRVLRDTIAYPIQIDAAVAVSGDLIWDESPPWDEAAWAYEFVEA